MNSVAENLNLVVGEDFEIYIRYEDDNGNLYDFSGYEIRFAGRCSSVADGKLFNFSSKHYDFAQTGSFDLVDNDGETQTFNIKIVMPASETMMFKCGRSAYFHLGVVLTPENGSPINVVTDEKVTITKPIA